MAEIPRGQSPEEPPPSVAGQRAPQPKPPKPEAPRERPVRAGANPEFAVERERWNQRLAEINPGTVNLADPDEVYAFIRGLRVADGPDEVHNRTIARLEIRRHSNTPSSSKSAFS